MRHANLRTLATVLCVFATSCHSESSNQASSESSAPAASGSAEPKDKLAKALASAITNDTAKNKPSASNDGSPPADGVFDEAKANAEVPSHSPPKVTLGSPGSDPKISLLHHPMTAVTRASLQIALEVGGGQGMPPMEFKLELKPSPGKDAKGVQSVTARVTDLSVSVPNVPAEFTAQLKQLVGSKVSYRVSEQGGAFDFSQELAKTKNPELGDLLEIVAQGLASANLATPSEPIGAGAYWMVASRRKLVGVDWIVYDMVKVANFAEKKVSLEINTRRYVVGRDIPAPPEAQAPKLTIHEVNASEGAQATLLPPSTLLSSYERTQSIKLLLDAEDDKGQRVMQTGGQMKFQIFR